LVSRAITTPTATETTAPPRRAREQQAWIMRYISGAATAVHVVRVAVPDSVAGDIVFNSILALLALRRRLTVIDGAGGGTAASGGVGRLGAARSPLLRRGVSSDPRSSSGWAASERAGSGIAASTGGEEVALAARAGREEVRTGAGGAMWSRADQATSSVSARSEITLGPKDSGKASRR